MVGNHSIEAQEAGQPRHGPRVSVPSRGSGSPVVHQSYSGLWHSHRVQKEVLFERSKSTKDHDNVARDTELTDQPSKDSAI